MEQPVVFLAEQAFQIENCCNGEVFIDFLKRLQDSVEGNITLIVDGHPVHKRKKVMEYVGKTNGRLKLYFQDFRLELCKPNYLI